MGRSADEPAIAGKRGRSKIEAALAFAQTPTCGAMVEFRGASSDPQRILELQVYNRLSINVNRVRIRMPDLKTTMNPGADNEGNFAQG